MSFISIPFRDAIGNKEYSVKVSSPSWEVIPIQAYNNHSAKHMFYKIHNSHECESERRVNKL